MDQRFLSKTQKIFKRCTWIELIAILTKGNVGRDLSSAKAGLDEISNYAKANDAVMVRNRSSIGPFKKNWYSNYLEMLDKSPNIGLVGNTINLTHHPDLHAGKISPHVQTYLYLSTYAILDRLRLEFPGMNESNRLGLISNGEIALSMKIMEMGYVISCHPLAKRAIRIK